MFHVEDVGGCVRGWFASVESAERRNAVLRWMRAASSGPDAVVSYAWQRVGTGHHLLASNVPEANVVMVFTWATAPTRVVMVVDVIDIDGVERSPTTE